MKRSFAEALLLLMMAGCARQAPPTLSLERRLIDLGAVYAGAVARGSMEVKNVGGDTLVFQKIVPACGCATTSIGSPSLAGGDSTTLAIEFHSAGYWDVVTKRIEIQTNDPQHPRVDVHFTSNVKSLLELNSGKPVLLLGDFPVRKRTRTPISIRNISDRPVTITGFEFPVSDVSARFSSTTLRPQDSVLIPLLISPAEQGYFNQQGFFLTTDDRQPKVPLRISFTGFEE